MRHLRILTLVMFAALPFAGATGGAVAATAHNSQAGSWGPTSHQCAPTPYFQQGGCLESYFTGPQNDALYPPASSYRHRRLTAPPEE